MVSSQLSDLLMNYSRDQVFEQLQRVMVELFELEEASITPEARLYEDLDIDSIDAVDLLIELKKITGKTIEPQQFKHVATIEDIVTIVSAMEHQ